MMICPNCGNEVNESYGYCPKCGAKIKVSQSALKEQIEETRHNERSCWVLISVGIVIAAFSVSDIRPSDHIVAGLVLAASFIAMGSGCVLLAYYNHKRKILLRQLNNIER